MEVLGGGSVARGGLLIYQTGPRLASPRVYKTCIDPLGTPALSLLFRAQDSQAQVLASECLLY